MLSFSSPLTFKLVDPGWCSDLLGHVYTYMAFQQVSGAQDQSPVPFWGAMALTCSFFRFCTNSFLFVPSPDFYSCSFFFYYFVLRRLHDEWWKQETWVSYKALSNHMYAVLMGTVCGRCITIEKSKYCFANLGSFSSYYLAGPCKECSCLLSLPYLSWFLLVSGLPCNVFSFNSHKKTFFFFSSPGDWSCVVCSSLHLFLGTLSLLSQGLRASRFFEAETEGQQRLTTAVALYKDLMTGPCAPVIYLSTNPRAQINSCAHAAHIMTVI